MAEPVDATGLKICCPRACRFESGRGSPARRSALRPRHQFQRVAQFALEELAAGVARQWLAGESDVARDLVAGDAGGAVGAQLVRRRIPRRGAERRRRRLLASRSSTPKTQHSATAWFGGSPLRPRRNRRSRRRGTMSFLRSTRKMKPSSSRRATSPVRSQPSRMGRPSPRAVDIALDDQGAPHQEFAGLAGRNLPRPDRPRPWLRSSAWRGRSSPACRRRSRPRSR